MTHALKAALLSGLVYPGLGQMTLKHYLRGLAFLLTATLGMVAAVVQASRMALAIIENMDLSRGAIGLDQIFQASHQAVTEANSIRFKIAIALILFSWIISTVDAYLLGRRMDRAGVDPQ
ncbi:MAG: hypothetical protein HZB87_00925 [Desulfatitalea sp.]|nr:hypothetical protein [Desulfatitalea sp.]MBI5897257.1 hypothetical protein [Desulfobacterales bacterium]